MRLLHRLETTTNGYQHEQRLTKRIRPKYSAGGACAELQQSRLLCCGRSTASPVDFFTEIYKDLKQENGVRLLVDDTESGSRS